MKSRNTTFVAITGLFLTTMAGCAPQADSSVTEKTAITPPAMKMAKYLDKTISSFLQSEPFKNWKYKKSFVENIEPPSTYYVFDEQGLEIECDILGDICTIFIHQEQCDGFKLSEIPFNLNHQGVLNRLGTPSKSGEKSSDPVLGEYGPWDSFSYPDFTLHVEYTVDTTRIKMITLMRKDVAPQ